MKHHTLISAVPLLLALALQPVEAHTGLVAQHGFLMGLIHPLSGWDHIVAMVSVGFWSTQLGGQARLPLALVFLVMMTVGAGFSLVGIALPMAETIIALSLLLMAGVFASSISLPQRIVVATVAAMAIFHGYVHAEELDTNSSALTYSAGFLFGTLSLLTTGRLSARISSVAPSIRKYFYALLCGLAGAAYLSGA